jgi:hypothetical protein
MKPTPVRPRKNRAYTLVEMMVALGVMGFVSIGTVSFTRQAFKMYYADTARLKINHDIRSFTAKLDSDAVTANYFLVYPGFSTRTTGSGATLADAAVSDGQVGDMLILVYTDPASTTTGVSMITELVGYYREITDTTLNNGPVHRFDITLSPSVAANSGAMYTILNTYVTGTASSYPIITQIAQGLDTNLSGSTPTPALFYNRQNRSVMVSAQVSELQAEQGSSYQVGNTYNFTVSPRG